jgi:formylglycine-generating enzyme required for sulfatase activity
MQPPAASDSSSEHRAPPEPAATHVDATAVRPAELAVLLRTDQARRWRRGERLRVEDYLSRYPVLSSHPDLLLDLIGSEVLLREEAGEEPDAAEYLKRFPTLEVPLRRHFALYQTLSAGGLPSFIPPTLPEQVRPPTPDFPTRVAPEASVPETVAPSASEAASSALAHLFIPGYEVLDVLGRGGMGVVYRARQEGLQRTVALKMILHADHASPRERDRFRNEAEAVARLQHPNIVQIFEVGEHQGAPFFVLEFCPGGTLAQRLTGVPWHDRDAAELVLILARAVHAAHLARVVHRDLTPGNVLFAADGTPKLTDFGLAKKLDEDGKTRPGDVLGTPSYMAPEQAAGRVGEIGPATDVYSLGAILYELVTGRPPFRGASIMETIDQVRSQEPVAPSRLQPKLPRDLETICLHCLEKTPQKRYATALALAEDLGRYLRHEPIRARPIGSWGRLVKWVRRRPGVAALMAAIVLLTAAGLGGITWAYRQAVDNLAEAREAQRRRILARVDQLQTATPQAVPDILAELKAEGDAVLPRLRELWAEKDDPSRRGRRMRVGQALLPADPEAVKQPLAAWMLETDDPRELVLARQALKDFATELAPELWRRYEDPHTPPEVRFRALLALAAFDPGNPRWQKAAATAAEELLAADKLYAPTLVEALDLVGAALIGPLRETFRSSRLPQRRLAAAEFLAALADDEPEILADLAAEADPGQFAILRPLLLRHRDAVAARLARDLTNAPPPWKQPVNWMSPEASVVAEIEAASGMITDHFALAPSLPLPRAVALVAELRHAGYRPVRFRPYRDGSTLRAAVVWIRDGRDFRLMSELSEKEVTRQDGILHSQHFAAQDLAGYLTPGAVDPTRVHYACLWVEADRDNTSRLLVGLSEEQLSGAEETLQKERLLPTALSSITLPGGTVHYSAVWRSGKEECKTAVHRDRLGIAGAHLDLLPVDITVSENPGWREEPWGWAIGSVGNPWLALAVGNWSRLEVGQPFRYAGVWKEQPGWQGQRVVGLDPAAHRTRCRELAAEGYRPAALSAATVAGRTRVTSLWERPDLGRAEREARSRRQANAAAALLVLGQDGSVWNLLRHAPEPDARSLLIQRLAAFRVDARQLAERLRQEQDPSIRQALILALGDYAPEQLPADLRQDTVPRLLAWYRDDPDPGIHAAIAWLLGHAREGPTPRAFDWGQAEALHKIDRERQGQPPGPRRWFVGAGGQTFTAIPGPVEFTMGLPAEQPHETEWDVQHRRRIDRSFAIAATPVTSEQFRGLLRQRNLIRPLVGRGEAPAAVDFYDAVLYCRWLSEKEGVAPDQMCYPGLEEIAKCKKEFAPLRLPPDFLRRTGYRLPTDAEWEYTCRAGATTLRFFGELPDLLDRYAWYLSNSGDQALPVGQKRPNELGLFDLHGPLWQWCHPSIGFPAAGGLDDNEDRRHIIDSEAVMARGGAFPNPPRGLRAGLRHFFYPRTNLATVGFRLARTLP